MPSRIGHESLGKGREGLMEGGCSVLICLSGLCLVFVGFRPPERKEKGKAQEGRQQGKKPRKP